MASGYGILGLNPSLSASDSCIWRKEARAGGKAASSGLGVLRMKLHHLKLKYSDAIISAAQSNPAGSSLRYLDEAGKQTLR